VKTSNIDALMTARTQHVEALAQRATSFRQLLDESEKKRELVFRGISEGLGKKRIARKYNLNINSVARACKALACEGRLEWDREKGGNGGWRARG
jgi:hypothetical protein